MSASSPLTAEVIAAHGITPSEFDHIVALLGRTPNLVELGIFSVMWSEHCSYKSSRIYLKNLPTTGERVVQGPGENAGVINIGEGWCIAFKIESHNHPSFIEPFQGAATGVGGILRDIFTMGARPVALLNSLRFGRLDDPQYGPRNRAIFNGVVRGIGHYGNAFGCPTIGGEVYFADCYSPNPLVNAFALGLVREDQIFFGRAKGISNSVLYVGAKTGRDGIHGATMASAEFDDEALSKRPTVQVGDPFCEKLLLEACLEAMRAGCVVGIQDMGAAGLTSSSCEMGARAGNGIDIDVALVPQRETGMTPYEILLSESQERMLLVAAPGREREVQEIFARWELSAVIIGHVIQEPVMRVRHFGEIVADIPNTYLTDEAPRYQRPCAAPAGMELPLVERLRNEQAVLDEVLPPAARNLSPNAVASTLRTMLGSLNLSSREWVYQQYDHMVRTNTVILPGADASVVRVKETRKAIAISLDGNGRYCAIDPHRGAELLVAESCRNLVTAGAKPIGLTNCLNFASPERPEVMWAFREAVAGMGVAARIFETPVVSGNVSLYNETEGRGIYPTPVIGSVGLIEDIRYLISNTTVQSGDVVLLLGASFEELGATEFLERQTGQVVGPLPQLEYDREQKLHSVVLESAVKGLHSGAHDLSDGGLLVALAELSFSLHGRSALGMALEMKREGALADLSIAGLLFGETPSRMLVTVQAAQLDKFLALAAEHSLPCTQLGVLGGTHLKVTIDGTPYLDEPVAELEHIWRTSLGTAVGI
ncbi:MAG TPA: phosphoribosylformylglycinamidine synthase subunit PurL [Acidobacteriota bacterium]|nr:phosphoribosylformylglycinamidine synthase subunit PurL [Acidobacteriota bacterium]HNC42642.1 phosphoribosylformylglycinamidine synthase subunit PurL [Acidobacteriota bacterium]HND18257.1 phosphoribosylformylglycinamidine synthase subunit PurL [Acidobacteriota bacterium]